MKYLMFLLVIILSLTGSYIIDFQPFNGSLPAGELCFMLCGIIIGNI